MLGKKYFIFLYIHSFRPKGIIIWMRGRWWHSIIGPFWFFRGWIIRTFFFLLFGFDSTSFKLLDKNMSSTFSFSNTNLCTLTLELIKHVSWMHLVPVTVLDPSWQNQPNRLILISSSSSPPIFAGRRMS